MKLLVNRIVAEFNKIFAGTKRVGDSLRLEGKRMTDLDVSNAATLGHKTESQLSVNQAVSSEQTILIQSFDENGVAKVNIDGDPVYIKEHQLSVNNAKYLRGVDPINLEVDIASRLRTDAFHVINVSSLVVNPELYRVKDSELLGGKYESELSVTRAEDADNADLLNNTTQDQLVVEKSRISTKLLSDDGQEELLESELRVHDANYLRNGSTLYNLYNIRDWLVEQEQVADVYVNLAASSNTLTTDEGNKSFAEIMTFIKEDSTVEAYQATRLVTSDNSTPSKTGDQYKTWVIGHDEFKNKVATLTSALSDRAVRFGSDTDNVNIDEMDARIKSTTVDLAANSNKVENNTVEDIIATTRTRILSQSSGTNGLTQLEVDGFFGNNKVKLAVQAIEVNNSLNADTLTDTDGVSSISLSSIYQQVKDNGGVLSAKYIYSDPAVGGQKSYIDITNDITDAKTDLIDGASSDYMSLSRVETVIKNNKTEIETSLSTEITNRTNADSTLQSNIDVETSRIDTILSGADSDKNTFSELRSYVDSLTGDLSTTDTDLGGDTLNVVNITNALEARLVNFENSTTTNVSSLSGEVDAVEASVGLKSNGGIDNFSGTNYYDSANTVLEAIDLLDSYLKVEETTRISQDNTLSSMIGTLSNLTTTAKDNIVDALNEEKARAISVEGTLNGLSTSNKTNLVSAINELDSDINTEATTRTNADDALDTKITNTNTAIATEITNRMAADGDLTTLSTTTRSNLVASINEVVGTLATEISNRTSNEGVLSSLKTSIRTNLVGAINENYDSIAQEVTNRTTAVSQEASTRSSADSTLQSNITSVLSKVNNIVDGLGVDTIDNNGYISVSGTTYLDSLSTTFYESMVTLDSSLNSVNNTLQGNINTEATKINNIVSGLGFSNIATNGAIVISGTEYLDAQTTVLSALTTLDEEIRSRFTTLDLRLTNLDIGDIPINGSIVPDTDIAYDLGSSSNRFKDLYLNGNTIYMGDYSVSVNPTTGVLSTVDSTDGGATPVNLLTDDDIGNTVQAYSIVLNNTTASYTTTEKSKLSGIEDGADNTSSNETSHADVVVDGDFTQDGFLKRSGGSGNYIVDTNSYSLSSHNHAGVYQPADSNIVSDASYVHTDNNYTAVDASKVGIITTAGDGSSYLSNDGTYKSWDSIIAEPASTLSLSSSSTITLDAVDRVKIDNAPFRLPLFTTTGRDALTATNGDMIYNTDLNKFQGYQNGAWINLDGTV